MSLQLWLFSSLSEILKHARVENRGILNFDSFQHKPNKPNLLKLANEFYKHLRRLQQPFTFLFIINTPYLSRLLWKTPPSLLKVLFPLYLCLQIFMVAYKLLYFTTFFIVSAIYSSMEKSIKFLSVSFL